MTPTQRAQEIADQFFGTAKAGDPDKPIIEQYAPPNVIERHKALLVEAIADAIREALNDESDLRDIRHDPD